ncbi:hypothetical protein RKD37_000167 [Streptomyces ambofaciens]
MAFGNGEQVQDDVGPLAFFGAYAGQGGRELLQRVGVQPQRGQRSLVGQRESQLGTLDVQR